MSVPDITITITDAVVEYIESNRKFSELNDCPFCEYKLPIEIIDIEWCYGDADLPDGGFVNTVAIICPTCRAQGPMMCGMVDAYDAWNTE